MEILPWWWTEMIRWQEAPSRFHMLWSQIEQMPIIDNGNQWLKDLKVKCHWVHRCCWRE